MDQIRAEAERRRTFAIISHPDSGKTTLTEKLLLYARAIHLAGSVKSRKAARHAVSDWMQMEQERGISVTSSVLQFEHHGKMLNLLDTPGHADFSEDTYRTLAAVDSAVMLMDHAKGVEPRTRKLFEVCRLRNIPVITFMNKLDRAGLDPLELVDDVSSSLNLKVAPINWPLGMGRDFKGVVDIKTRDILVFDAEAHGTTAVEAKRLPWSAVDDLIGPSRKAKLEEDLELIGEAGEQYDHDAFLRGELSPLFWGSAMNNFGVEVLLHFLAEHAAPPDARVLEDGVSIDVDDPRFTGFVFKIQANMNPKHRDRIVFMRVVSGEFEKDMEVTVGRSGQSLRMARPQTFMAQERNVVDAAFPGDIVGVFDTGKLRVGDTVSSKGQLKFSGIPRFAPEHFGQLRLKDPLKRKALDTGLEQLAHEGVIQVFYRSSVDRQNPYLGAVGMLQFEVLKERLKNEYSVTAVFEGLDFRYARWIQGNPEALAWLKASSSFTVVEDRNGSPVLLTDSEWGINYALQNAPKGLELFDIEPL
ncbi:MAG: peptide chain release factor 3 [Myxococcales bacterium]|nr:peptide chain release factor 3 [Myxococcales bacterium]MCB9652172.1 peptide chain release factor 3 [Deltaproteobacteria bacterium]